MVPGTVPVPSLMSARRTPRPAAACRSVSRAPSSSYRALAETVLGAGILPFATFAPPADMQYDNWYKHSSLGAYRELVDLLVRHAGPASYLVEVGSFIGNSATTWAKALRRSGWASNCSVLCIDTWLGDVKMWRDRGKWLGTQGSAGEPRLFEQVLLNVRGNGVDDLVLPLRASSIVGLKLLNDLVNEKKLPRPRVIYLDAAHEQAETSLEMRAAWQLLAPEGFLVGDDFHATWPGVQMAVHEFVTHDKEVVPVHEYACAWPFAKQLRVLKSSAWPHGPGVVLLGRQWLMQKRRDASAKRRYANVELVKASFTLGTSLWPCACNWSSSQPSACDATVTWRFDVPITRAG